MTVEGDGNFSYTPPVGFSGADHFDYVITDDGPDDILGNADDLTGAGRVTINVTTQRVWYVKNDAARGGMGRSTDRSIPWPQRRPLPQPTTRSTSSRATARPAARTRASPQERPAPDG